MTNRLSIQDLRLTIGNTQILAGVSFDVPAGQITGLAGESGSGKTITGMTVCGLQPTNAIVTGTVDYQGRNLLTAPARAMNALRGSAIAVVFQDPTASLHPMLNIGTQLTDHLRHHERVGKAAARVRAVEGLKALDVIDAEAALKRYPHQFSGGQLQRIAIASALICNPSILIADEPTTALDVIVQAGILRLLRRLCDELGLAILLVSHDLGVMSAVADRIVVMRQGQVVEQGSRYNIITSPQAEYTRSLIASLPNGSSFREQDGR